VTFQPVPDAAEVVVNWTHVAGSYSNTLWFRKPGFGIEDMEDLAFYVSAQLEVNLASYIANNFTQDRLTVYDQRVDGGPIVLYSGNPWPGQDADELHDLATALVLTFRSATRGRSGRGRLYLGGLSVGQSADGVFSASIIGAAGALMSDLYDAKTVTGWEWVVCSRWHDGSKRAVGVTYPIISWTVRSGIPGKQSSRAMRP
jgi:hypothetical protein